MKRCGNCRHGIDTVDAGNRQPYVICALIPPTSAVIDETVEIDGNMVTKLVVKWLRPSMTVFAFCGQHRLSWRKFLFGGKGT